MTKLAIVSLSQAAAAIAKQLQPDDIELRDQTTNAYRQAIFDVLCDAQLVGRDPTFLLPIVPGTLAAAIAFGGCLIRLVDLNAWLDGMGLDIAIEPPAESTGQLLPPEPDILVPVPSNAGLLAQQEEQRRLGDPRPNVTLANRYGLSTRQVKDRCKKARDARTPKAFSIGWPSR